MCDECRDGPHADVERVLISSEQIDARLCGMALEIADVYAGQDAGLTLAPVMSGAIVFVADLIRKLPLKMKLAMTHVSTYPGATTQAHPPRVVVEPVGDLAGRHVLIVDDILDSGSTLRRVRAMAQERGALSVRSAVLLRKPGKAPPDVPVEFVGFDIDDLFVVGYGLDYDDHYRNFPHVGVLRAGLMP